MFNGKAHQTWAIFNSYVSWPEGTYVIDTIHIIFPSPLIHHWGQTTDVRRTSTESSVPGSNSGSERPGQTWNVVMWKKNMGNACFKGWKRNWKRIGNSMEKNWTHLEKQNLLLMSQRITTGQTANWRSGLKWILISSILQTSGIIMNHRWKRFLRHFWTCNTEVSTVENSSCQSTLV